MTESCGQPVLSQQKQFDSDKPSPLYVSYSQVAKATHLPSLAVSLSAVLSEGGRVSMCVLCVRAHVMEKHQMCVFTCACIVCASMRGSLKCFYSEAHCSR